MSESKKAPTVKWPKSTTFDKQPVQLPNKPLKKSAAVAVVRYTCPTCKTYVALTVDKKNLKAMIQDVKNGGNPIPPGVKFTAPIIHHTLKEKK